MKHGRSADSISSSEAGSVREGSIGGFPRHEADNSTADASAFNPPDHAPKPHKPDRVAPATRLLTVSCQSSPADPQKCETSDLINALQKGNDLAGELLGIKAGYGRDKIPEMITQANDKRATVIALTIILASREIPTSDEHVWRDGWEWASQRKTAAPYLTFLRDQLGYTLSPIEAAVAAGEQFDPLAADAEAAGQDGLTVQEPNDQDEGGKDAEADNPADAAGHQADETAGEDEAPASTEAG